MNWKCLFGLHEEKYYPKDSIRGIHACLRCGTGTTEGEVMMGVMGRRKLTPAELKEVSKRKPFDEQRVIKSFR